MSEDPHPNNPTTDRCPDCRHPWRIHGPDGCNAWVDDPEDDHATCPCVTPVP